MADRVLRSPTFLVGTTQQRGILDEFHRRDEHLAEEYQYNKPLCFSSRAFQKTHPGKASKGSKDADATLASPMLLGVADGVSQIEDYGMDASELPNQLLGACEEIAVAQLMPGLPVAPQESYRGPIALLRRAFEMTDAMGSTTALLAVLDNSTRIHGKLHPMVAVITVGDCELLMLRRYPSRAHPLQASFHTEMQRIDGHSQTPLQVARLDDRVDPDFDESISIEVIERGSAVHCVSAYEGDILVMGSDGIFDNLFLDEVVDLCNSMLPARAGRFSPTHPALLESLAQRLVVEAHSKTSRRPGGGYPDAPIGKGGKMDDTSVVVGEVVEWTEAHTAAWAKVTRVRRPASRSLLGGFDFMNCGSACSVDEDSEEEYDECMGPPSTRGSGRSGRHRSRGSFSKIEEDDDSGRPCSIS